MDEKKKEDEPTGEEKAPAAPAKSGGNKMMFLGLIVGILVLNTVVAFVLVNSTKPKSEKESHEKKEKVDSTSHAEHTSHLGATTDGEPIEVVVNVAGTDGERFLKAVILFEYDDVAYPLLGEEISKWMPKLKDLFIENLSRITLAELTEIDAKEKIRKNLVKKVNEMLPASAGQVREVLFNQFIIQ